jgi:hypothetical protein
MEGIVVVEKENKCDWLGEKANALYNIELYPFIVI